MRLGSNVIIETDTPNLSDWMAAYVVRFNRGPSADEIREAVNFSQPGGIARLISALEQCGAQMARRYAGGAGS